MHMMMPSGVTLEDGVQNKAFLGCGAWLSLPACICNWQVLTHSGRQLVVVSVWANDFEDQDPGRMQVEAVGLGS